ncbi:putative ABC transporter permease protein [Microlunatus phosphovorus NM-1]|uniref:Putative ABC transporter permease protein n=1 Tax=Microlunatus phosphovorus (strain ATCC 700054 / DSM 10555 / JCM 9379 / NBRC 101784 / NCIMB 13414 / VKM Ac-1990 / NM-1) TaxID=1032480 RepID=F5XDZ5_MICPN|nr:carbohydrate ABC transporter permease [Microlunatus phosphovorus]BAK35168.1 putative ABC transporter permease protein [Microlunatus phosphovorus NM-1]
MLFNLGRRALVVVYTLIIAVPVLVVVFGSFKTQQQLFANPFLPTFSPELGNYSAAIFSQGIGRALVNSILVTVTSVILTLVIASLAAYAVARIPGWKGHLIFAFLILGMAIPAQANMIPQRVLFESLGLLDSLLGLVVINITVTLPVATFILGGFMKTLPPALFEAGEIDGAGPMRAFVSIAVPLSAPSIAATTIFLFVIQWNDLLYPLLFIQSPEKKTLPLALLGFQGEFLTNYPLLFTGVIVSSLPIVVAYVFLQRYFVAGITAGATKG